MEGVSEGRQDNETLQSRSAQAAAAAVNSAEFDALSYFAIGVASEGSDAGRDVSNSLAFAGSIRQNGLMYPAGNSGFSIGTLQTDLGQHPDVARRLVDAYQAWVRTEQPGWMLSEEQAAQAIHDLGRTGSAIDAEHHRPPDPTVKAQLDHFLKTSAGIRFVHEQDSAQADKLMQRVYSPLADTALFGQLSKDDQTRLAVVIAKAYNQSERRGGRILQRVEDGTLASLDEVKQAIKDIPDGSREYMRTGRDAALEGAEVLIALRNSDPHSPLHDIWASVAADPLADPTRLDQDASRPDFAHEYAAVKTLFLQRQEAPAFIAALDRGAVSIQGRRDKAGTAFVDDGLYAAGDDFVVWDADGKGQARVGGEWSEVHRDTLAYSRNADGTIDLDRSVDGRSERLLHADRRAPALRPVAAARDGAAPAHASLEADESRRAIERLAPRDRECLERFAQAARQGGYDGGEAARIAGAALLAMRRDPLIRSADEVRMHGGDLVVLHAPHGALPPMFHLRVDASRAAVEPLEASLAQLQALDRQQQGVAADIQAQEVVERSPALVRA